MAYQAWAQVYDSLFSYREDRYNTEDADDTITLMESKILY